MKFLYDYFPIICFFVAYKLWGIYVATVVAMVASLLLVAHYYWRHHKFEKMHVITLAFILVLGGATLIFHNPIFIKWKPTIVYWVFAIAMFSTHVWGDKPLMQRMLGEKIELPHKMWAKLNISWGIFFTLLGVLNLYVVYHYDTNAWVNFKLFGTMGLMVLFVIGQAFYMSPYIRTNTPKD